MLTLTKNSTVDDIQQQSYWLQIDAEMLGEAQAIEAKNVLELITALTAAHRVASNGVKGDGDLSESGRRSRLVALIQKSDDDLDKTIAPLASRLEKQILTAERSIANALKVEPSVQDVLKMIEVRQICSNLDPLIVQSKLLALATSGDDDLSVQAILTASSIEPLVSPDVAVRARAFMSVRLRPDQSNELDVARDVLSILKNSAATATNSFATPTERNALGIASDPVARAALGRGRSMSEPASQAPQA